MICSWLDQLFCFCEVVIRMLFEICLGLITSLSDFLLLITSVMSSAYAIDFGAFLTGWGDE